LADCLPALFQSSIRGKESLFQQAAHRLSGLGDSGIDVEKPIIITGDEHRFLAAEQLREMGIDIGAALLGLAGNKIDIGF
jgi:mannose-1-phosphate guanylyltransferase/mannose-6-phosphate isomerase